MDSRYLITIDGIQMFGDDQDSISLSTFGSYRRENDHYYISYEESAATGFEGDVTTLEVEADRRVTLYRRGVSNTQLIIERGQRHLSHYNTDFGGAMVGVNARKIVNKLGDSGGVLELCYSLDYNASELSENRLNITVKEM